MGRPKRRHTKSASCSSAESLGLNSTVEVSDDSVRSGMDRGGDFMSTEKFSSLLSKAPYSSRRLNEVQLLKETISESIRDIYRDSLAAFAADVQRIRIGDLYFSERTKAQDCHLLKAALRNLLQLDDSKEVYHLTFVQVNWFVDQLIRAVRSLEGCGSSVLMAAVTRAWNVTKTAAQRLDSFLFPLFKTEKTVSDFSCLILNKQILIEKLRKEPLIIALNEQTADWQTEDDDYEDRYEGMSIDQIVHDIEEPSKRRRKSTDVEEFRQRLETKPTPLCRIKVACRPEWIQQLQKIVMSKCEEVGRTARGKR